MFKYILNIIRKYIYLEYISYFLQNNILNRLFNFSGSGNFQRKDIYDRYNSIYSNYLQVIKNSSVNIHHDDIIIDFGFGYSSVNSYKFAQDFNLRKVIAYDEFNVRQTIFDEKYITKNFDNISNVEHVYGIDNLSKLLHKLGKRRYILFSNAVFEHVWNLNDVFGLIDRFSISGSVHYHGIDLRCHNKFLAKGPLYFHRFSKFFWKIIANNIGHPNRLLKDDYIKLFNTYNYQVDIINEISFSNEILKDAQQYLNISSNQLSRYSCSNLEVFITKL